jgi:hypothetical protein
MPAPQFERRKCPHCGIQHAIYKRISLEKNHGHLLCRKCGGELVAWYGHLLYTYQGDPPDSSIESSSSDTVMNMPAQKPRE